VDWQYLAGFFDGDGCISVKRSRFRCQLSNINLRVLEEIRNFLEEHGIKVYISKDRIYHTLEIHKMEDVVKFLSALLPFLIVKKDYANLVIAYLAHRMAHCPRIACPEAVKLFKYLRETYGRKRRRKRDSVQSMQEADPV